jgi:hypothetical protein
MSKFNLKQVAKGKFRITCGEDTVGSISVEPNEVNDLLRCWSGSVEGGISSSPKPQAQMSSHKNPMIAAMMRLKSKGMSQGAILRGC